MHGLVKWGQKDWRPQCPGPTECGEHLLPQTPRVGGVQWGIAGRPTAQTFGRSPLVHGAGWALQHRGCDDAVHCPPQTLSSWDHEE